MNPLFSICYAIILVWIVIFELTRKKSYALDTLSFINIFYTLGFILPGMTINYDIEYQGWYSVSEDLYKDHSLQSFMIVFLGYFTIVLGYLPNKQSIIKQFVWQLKFFNGYIKFRLYVWVSLAFIISLVSIYIYSSVYGSISHAIVGANMARAGYGIENPYTFFIRFIPAVVLPMYMVASEYKQSKRKWLHFTLLVLMLVLVIIGFLFMAGRANFVILFGLLLIIIQQGVIKTKQVVLGTIILLIFMFFGDPIFNAAQYSDNSIHGFITEFQSYRREASKEGVLKKIVEEFCYPFVSLNCALAKNETFTDYRYFLDPIYAVIALLPDRLVGIAPPDTVAYPNTENVLGYYTSIVPPGIFAYGLFNFGYIGIILTTYFFGYLSRIIDNFFMSYNFRYKLALYFPWALAMGTFVINGEPRVWLLSQFMLVFYSTILLLFHSNLFKNLLIPNK